MKITMRRIIYAAAILTLLMAVAFIFAHNSAGKPNMNSKKTEKVIESTHGIKVTFIELGSVGCLPCDMMQPILDEIEKEYEGQVAVRFYDVRSLFGKPYAQKYGIRMIPTQVFLDKDGNEYYRHSGFFPKDELVKILEQKGVE
ncbi:thioredoxin family protein [Candidatus Margulisiibacteriota bacterium]